MRPRTLVSLVVLALIAGACGHGSTDVSAPTASVVPPFVSVALGKHQRFIGPSGAVWTVTTVDGGYVSPRGTYYAPLRSLFASIDITARVGTAIASATVYLKPIPSDSLDCLAEGQDPSAGDYVYVEELPEAIRTVDPIYPDIAREAGVDGLVMVLAHVCACGEVTETRIVKSIPLLDSAAEEAVRKWLFKPALTGGEPVAVWVGVPVKFTLP